MENQDTKWQIVSKVKQNPNISDDQIISLLLKNRDIVTPDQKKDFLNPKDPIKIGTQELEINHESLEKAVKRVQRAIENDEEMIIYGDYDADGICSTAILWETIYKFSKKIKPYIPDRFSDGYGINPASIERILAENSQIKLIITVDNGIVAFDAIKKANGMGVDVIITDHHQKDKKLPKAYSIIHTDKISGSGVSWIFARELVKRLSPIKNAFFEDKLELAAIGTIADQLPLTGANRSIVSHGLNKLLRTRRYGLKELYKEAAIADGFSPPKTIGTYEVNYLIAPRLNAMGRLENAIDSLRLICTKDPKKAFELASLVGMTNRRRQKIVDEVLEEAKKEALKDSSSAAIVISGKYHEGVIGLAAGKLVEDFGRPAVVFSEGETRSKASARSVDGFNIVVEIKRLEKLLLGVGGHPMAAGLSIETKNIQIFKEKFQKNSLRILTKDLLSRTVKIDMLLEFDQLNLTLAEKIDRLKPFGIGNPYPVFETNNVEVVDARVVGTGGKHVKLLLRKNGITVPAIAFNLSVSKRPKTGDRVDLAYSVEKNTWNNKAELQLKIKDLKLNV